MNSRIVKLGLAAALAVAFAAPAFAQTPSPPASDIQRNVNQQQRIEEGLKSGQLNTREAGKLERGEARIEKMEANAGKNGSVSAREQARITAAQNRESCRTRPGTRCRIHCAPRDSAQTEPATHSAHR